MPLDTDNRLIDHAIGPPGRLGERLTAIDRRLAGIDRLLAAPPTPGRIRYRPIRRALWRILLLRRDDVLFLYRRQIEAAAAVAAGAGAPDLAGPAADALQALAIAVVARAILGNVRAICLLFDLIEGRPRRRREAQPSSGLDPVEIEQLVRLFQERAAASPAGAG